MRNIVFTSVILVIICGHGECQSQQSFKAWIRLIDSQEVVSGTFVEVKDSAISVENIQNRRISTYSYLNIQTIKLRRKKRIGNGIWIGAVGGFATGVVIGLTQGPQDGLLPSSGSEVAVRNGILLIVPGALIGAGIGSIKKKTVIDGDHENFQKFRAYCATY